MHFLTISSMLALAASVSAGVIVDREDVDRTHDGIYTASKGKVSGLKHRRRDYIPEGSSANETVSADLDARDCKLEPGDCHETVWAKSASSIAFFCNWRDDLTMVGADLDHAISMVQDQCGKLQGGSYSDQHGNFDLRTYSYGWTDWKRQGWCNYNAGYDY
ncbi:hypothetical protein F4778DRAFT_576302 [Xylariomycetidae sp. FL2044]|nr:hypothetical protein F4778DRAFT_576302 [Xylariomycetidae sp. FL2044]